MSSMVQSWLKSKAHSHETDTHGAVQLGPAWKQLMFLSDPHCSSSPGSRYQTFLSPWVIFFITWGHAIFLKTSDYPFFCSKPTKEPEMKTVILAFLKGIPNLGLFFASHVHLNVTYPKRSSPQLQLDSSFFVLTAQTTILSPVSCALWNGSGLRSALWTFPT